ncbi:MAG TPA: aldehyde dehydrogenase family protein, partial [Victivallales bacterium]|nr:aldehyde dehydrogenase family protein [Victivallales bacterium]
KLNAGSIMINDHLMSHGLAETPWGGFKDSGFGKTHSVFGLEEMCRIKTIINDTLAFRKRNIFWHPYSPKIYAGLESMLSVLYEASLWKKLKALPKLLAIFLSYFRRD